MKFTKARDLAKTLMVFCLVLCVFTLLTKDPQLSMLMGIGSVIIFVASIVLIALYCKCPYCGKHVYLGLFKMEYCPKCRRNYETGIKKKGKR